jgi:hypothetical protein
VKAKGAVAAAVVIEAALGVFRAVIPGAVILGAAVHQIGADRVAKEM